MDSIKEEQVFTKHQRVKWDSSHKRIINAPRDHQKIRVNLIFAVKHDGRHKTRLVADGSLTPEPVKNIYSGVVSLRHLRLVIFLGELNNLELWRADIVNAYLEATPMKSSSSLLAQNFKNWKASFSSSTKHFMVSNLVVKGGQKGSMISSKTWDSRLPK